MAPFDIGFATRAASIWSDADPDPAADAARGIEEGGKRFIDLFDRRAEEEIAGARADATSDPGAVPESERDPLALWSMASKLYDGARIAGALEQKQDLGRRGLRALARDEAARVDPAADLPAMKRQVTLALSKLDAKHQDLVGDLAKIRAGQQDDEVAALRAEKARTAERTWMAENQALHLTEELDAFVLDEDAVYALLRGRSEEDMDAIRQAYLERTGRDLDGVLAERLDRDEMLVAAAFLTAADAGSARVQEAVARLRVAGGLLGDAGDLSAALDGLEAGELQAVADAYLAQTGRTLAERLAELDEEDAAELGAQLAGVDLAADRYAPERPPELLPGEEAPEPAEVERLAAELRAAMASTTGTDEERIYQALAGRSPAMLHAIRKEFESHYDHQGGTLLDAFRSEMEGVDLQTALALLDGDPVRGAVARLVQATDGAGTRVQVIHETLASLPDAAMRAQVRREFFKQTGERLVEEVLEDELGGLDLDLARAEVRAGGEDEAEGAAKAKAIELEMAVNDGALSLLPFAGDVDVDQLCRVLEEIDGPAERDEVLRQLEAQTGRSRGELEALIERKLFDEAYEKDAVLAYLDGDRARGDAARIMDARESVFGDENAVIAQLYGKRGEAADRHELTAAYGALADEHAFWGTGESIDELVDDLGGTEAAIARGWVEDGAVAPELLVEGAVGVLNDDEDAILKRIVGRSPEEIDATLRRPFEERHPGQSFDDFVLASLDGRDRARVAHALARVGGDDLDAARHNLAADQELYDFERGGAGEWIPGGHVVSNRIMDLFSETGGDLDAQNDERAAWLARLDGAGALGDEEARALATHQRRLGLDAGNYVEAKDAVTENVARGWGTVAGATLTAVTGGGAAPLMAAALAGGLTNMATRLVLQGKAYSGKDLALDAARTAGHVGTAGFAGSTLAGLDKVLGPTLASAVAGGVSGAADGALDAALDERALGGGAGGWANGLADAGSGGLFRGLVGGLLGQKLSFPSVWKGGILADAMGRPQGLGQALGQGALSGAVGNVAVSALADEQLWRGDLRLEDLGARVAGAALEGGLSGAAGGYSAHTHTPGGPAPADGLDGMDALFFQEETGLRELLRAGGDTTPERGPPRRGERHNPDGDRANCGYASLSYVREQLGVGDFLDAAQLYTAVRERLGVPEDAPLSHALFVNDFDPNDPPPLPAQYAGLEKVGGASVYTLQAVFEMFGVSLEDSPEVLRNSVQLRDPDLREALIDAKVDGYLATRPDVDVPPQVMAQLEEAASTQEAQLRAHTAGTYTVWGGAREHYLTMRVGEDGAVTGFDAQTGKEYDGWPAIQDVLGPKELKFWKASAAEAPRPDGARLYGQVEHAEDGMVYGVSGDGAGRLQPHPDEAVPGAPATLGGRSETEQRALLAERFGAERTAELLALAPRPEGSDDPLRFFRTMSPAEAEQLLTLGKSLPTGDFMGMDDVPEALREKVRGSLMEGAGLTAAQADEILAMPAGEARSRRLLELGSMEEMLQAHNDYKATFRPFDPLKSASLGPHYDPAEGGLVAVLVDTHGRAQRARVGDYEGEWMFAGGFHLDEVLEIITAEQFMERFGGLAEQIRGKR